MNRRLHPLKRLAVLVLDAACSAVLAGLEFLFPDPVDDTMALAVSLGEDVAIDSTTPPRPSQSTIPYVEQVIDWHAHPAHRPEFEDAHMGQLIELWRGETR